MENERISCRGKIVTIKNKLPLLMIIIGCIPLIVLSFLVYDQTSKSLFNSSKNNLLQLTISETQLLNELVDTQSKETEYFASRPDVIDLLKERANHTDGSFLQSPQALAMNQTLADWLDNSTELDKYRNLVVVDLNGVGIASTLEASRGTNYSSRQYFQDVVKTGKPAISDVVIGKANGKAGIVFAMPVKDENGQLIGLLGNMVYCDYFANYVSKIKPGNTGYISIIDQNGLVLIHPDATRLGTPVETEKIKALAQEIKTTGKLDLHTDSYTYQGTEKYAGFNVIPKVNWLLIVAQNKSEVYAPATAAVYTIFITMGIILIVAIFISVFFARSITVPIRRLIHSMDDATSGDLTSLSSHHSKDELGQLSNKFNTMMKELDSNRSSLMRSEERYRRIFQHIQDVYIETRLDGTILIASPSVHEILGYAPEELAGTNIADLYADPLFRAKVIQELLQNKIIRNVEVELKCAAKDGNHKLFWLNAQLVTEDDGSQKIIGLIRDVTQYLEAKRRGEESEAQYKLLFDRMLNGYFAIEPVFDENHKLEDIRFVDTNLSFENHSSRKAHEVLGRTWFQAYGFRNRYLHIYEQLFLTGQPQTYEVHNPDLDDKHQLASAFLISENRAGVIFENITDRVKAEQELKHREEKYRHIFENIQDIYIETRLDGIVLIVSPSVQKILGYAPEELEGTNIAVMYANPYLRAQVIQELLQNKVIRNVEIEGVAKDGARKILSLNGQLMTEDDGSQRIIGMIRDVTQYLDAKRKQEELEAQYKLLFDKMMNGLLVLEPIYDEENVMIDVLLVDANPAYERLTGMKADDIKGKTWLEVFKYRNRFLHYYQQVLETGEYLQFENFNLLLKQYFNTGLFKIDDNRIGGVFEDITERKLAEEEIKALLANQTAIFESTDEMIWLVDDEQRLIMSNQAFVSGARVLFGVVVTPGTRLPDIYPHELDARWQDYYAKALQHEQFTLELAIDPFIFEVSFNPIYIDGKAMGVAIFSKDITARKAAETEIVKLNSELEQRVVERTSELQVAVNELEAFAYTVSHDLKSPLRAIDGYSKIMLEDYGTVITEDMADMVGKVRHLSGDMILMINKLLQYSTTSKLTIYKEPVNIDELFRMIFQDFQTAYPDRSMELIIEQRLPHVMADELLLKQAIYNILSNAIKFTKARERACITIECQIQESEYVFSVMDNGIGFDMEYSGKLFGVFQRLHSPKEYEGSGLGLATVRKIVQGHGGRTWMQGKVNQGATLYFSLPIS